MEERTDPPGRGFLDKRVSQRMGVMLAGPAMSLLLAAVMFTVVFGAIGTPFPTTVVQEVLQGYPAEAAGVKPGDRIVSINGREVTAWEDVVDAFRGAAGVKARLTVIREGREKTLEVVPVSGEQGRGVVGIRPVLETRTEGIAQSIVDGFRQTLWVSATWLRQLVLIVTGRARLEVVSAVGMGQMIGEAAQSGLGEALSMIGVLSAIIGLGSLLPLPGLDGGRLLFLAIEAIRGRPMDPEKENMVHVIGIAIMLALGLAILLRDVQRLLG